MSDRGTHDFTLEQRMHDVQAILDAIGCKQAVLLGVSEGGPMSLLHAATYIPYPHRTSSLVIYGSYAKRSRDSDYPFGWTISIGNVYLRTLEKIGALRSR